MKYLPRLEQICNSSSNINFPLISVVKYLCIWHQARGEERLYTLIQVYLPYLHLIIWANLHLSFP